MRQLALNLSAHHGPENNIESQKSYNNNLETLNNNCRILLEQLLTGRKLTGIDAVKLGMLEYRKRFDELKKVHGIPVQCEYPKKEDGKGKKRHKVWWLEWDFINEFLDGPK